MSDPLQRLAGFDGGDPVPPLPAAEVRRRGDRLRRRQTLLAGVGAALVVAVVVTPLAVLGTRGDGGSDPQPAPAPTAPTAPVPAPELPSETSTSKAVEPEPAPSKTSSGTSEDAALLATVPLAAGWPAAGGDYSLERPGTGVAPFAYEACGSRLADPGVADRLRTRLSGPEDQRTRQLYVFDDAQGAVAHVDTVRAFYEGCPQEPVGSGITRSTEVSELTLGGQSLAVVRSYAGPDGAPTIGLDDLVVVRLGRSVLIDTAANEAVATERRIREQLREQSTALGTVVAAMCAFTEAGC